MLLEICVASSDDAVLAEAGGADRLELNSALEVGGLTPSIGTLQQTVEEVDIPVIAMTRPRPGGFHYSDGEFATLLRDAELLLSTGARGIAFGMLDSDRQVDRKRCQEIVRLASDRETIFHRAFDVCENWPRALEQLVDSGVTRIMTSGQQPTAIQGRDRLRQMVEAAQGRIEVLVAGGVRLDHLRELVQQTGCDQVHAGLRQLQTDTSHPGSHPVHFYARDLPAGHQYTQTDPSAVRAMKDCLESIVR